MTNKIPFFYAMHLTVESLLIWVGVFLAVWSFRRSLRLQEMKHNFSFIFSLTFLLIPTLAILNSLNLFFNTTADAISTLIIGVAISGFYFKRSKLEPIFYLDHLAPAAALLIILGRTGCILTGDGSFGQGTEFILPPLTITYPFSDLLAKTYGAELWNTPILTTDGVYVWNTPIIEIVICAGYYVYYLTTRAKSSFKPGYYLCLFLSLYAISRFMLGFLSLDIPQIEILKQPDVPVDERYLAGGLGKWHWYGFTRVQIFALALFMGSAYYMLRNKLNQIEQPEGN